MKKMLDIAYNFLQEKKVGSIKQIFETVKKELKVYWKEDFPTKLMSKIDEEKIGSLYTYLTTDGRFVMLDEDKWTIISTLKSEELHTARSKVIIETENDKSI